VLVLDDVDNGTPCSVLRRASDTGVWVAVQLDVLECLELRGAHLRHDFTESFVGAEC
jgi:hypothetical protein